MVRGHAHILRRALAGRCRIGGEGFGRGVAEWHRGKRGWFALATMNARFAGIGKSEETPKTTALHHQAQESHTLVDHGGGYDG